MLRGHGVLPSCGFKTEFSRLSANAEKGERTRRAAGVSAYEARPEAHRPPRLALSNSALHPHLILKEAGTGVSAPLPEQGQTDVVSSYGL